MVGRDLHRRFFAFAAFGVGLTLAGLAWLRRRPDVIDELYRSGNVLNTHEDSGLSLADVGRDLGRLQFVLLASLVVACATFAARRARTTTLAITTSFGVIFADSVTRYATTVAGHVYVKMCDDALISMRYARNFAAGRGLVYNPGESVDGFTNPLWTFLMVIPHALGLHEGVTSIPILAVGAVLLLAAGMLARAALESEGAAVPVQILVALAIMLDASTFEFTVVGLETPLLTGATSLVLYGALRGRQKLVAVGLTILTLARADGAVVAALLAGWLVIEEAATRQESLKIVARRRWRLFALIAVVASSLVAWRFAVYGHPAPNTYYLKVYPFGERIRTGLAEYGIRGILVYGLPAAFVLWAGSVHDEARRARRMLLPVVGLWIYSIYVGGDAFTYLRFLGPIVPFLWTAVGLAMAASWSRRTRETNALVFVVIALLVPVESERGVLGSAWDRSSWVNDNVVAAKTIEQNLPRGASIATFYAGMPYFAPNTQFVDVLGKTESHIAHERQIHGAIPGHNKFDFAYVYNERRPDVTYTAMSCDDVERFLALPSDERARRAALPRSVYQAPVGQLLDDTFRELYAPHRVVLREGEVHSGHYLGCWFVREGAPVSIFWQLARE